MDIESLESLLSDYEHLVKTNSNREEDDSIWASDFDFRAYDGEDAQLVDSLIVPFGKKTEVDVLKDFYEYRDKGLDFVEGTYKGHDKEYYEALRVKYNEGIANEADSLKKLELIESMAMSCKKHHIVLCCWNQLRLLLKVVSFKYMEDSISRLESAVDKCIENARYAGIVSGALMVIAQLNLPRKESISLLAKSIGISKKEATEYYDECIVR